MYSTVWNGEVLDWRFKIRKVDTLFYIGEIFIGHIFKISENNWSAVGKTPNKLCPVPGFGSRHYAANFLLKLEGYDGRDKNS
jgi:hypothetical protein